MQIYDMQNNLISSFDVYDDAYIEKTHNKLDILYFRVPKSLGYKIQEEGYVEIPEGRFVVKEKKVSGKSSVSFLTVVSVIDFGLFAIVTLSLRRSLRYSFLPITRCFSVVLFSRSTRVIVSPV